MEKELLSLLDDFNSGKLRAFGKYISCAIKLLMESAIDFDEGACFTLISFSNLLFIGQGCSMEQMEGIRDQQESLARLHFELTTKQDLTTQMSEDGMTFSII